MCVYMEVRCRNDARLGLLMACASVQSYKKMAEKTVEQCEIESGKG